MNKIVPTLFTALYLMLFSVASVAAGDAAAAQATVPMCMGCHGSNGEGRAAAGGQPAYPRLAGQVESYLVQAMEDYKNGVRNNPLMGAMAKGLSDADITNIAAYYAAFK